MRLHTMITPLALGLTLLSGSAAEAKKGSHKGTQNPGREQGHKQTPAQPRVSSRVHVLRSAPTARRRVIVTRPAPAPRGVVGRNVHVAPRYSVPEVRTPYQRTRNAGLPSGAVRVMFNGVPYFRVRHLFYRQGPQGFVVATPPLGAVVSWLPPHARLVVVGRHRYLLADGVYFQPVAGGYMVVRFHPYDRYAGR